MTGVFKREIRAYFSSPLGYIFIGIMYFLSGFFFTNILAASSAGIEYVFSGIFSFTMVLVPFLTMRLLSEDKKLKTDQLLLTSPVSVSGVVWGKYLAAFTVYGISVAVTILHVIVLATFTQPNWNIFLGNFLGVLVFGAALISIGLFISSLTESQMIAAVMSYAAVILISFIDEIASKMPVGLEFLKVALSELSFYSRYSSLVSGVLNLAHILFFISVTVVFNFLTVRIIEKKRWS